MIWQLILCRSANGVREGRNMCTGIVLQAAKPFSEIPKIPTIPILYARWAYFPYIGKYKTSAWHLANESKYRQYGPIVSEKLSKHLDIVHIFDPEDYKKVYRNEGRIPEKKKLGCLVKYRKERLEGYPNFGLGGSSGEEWHKIRSHVQQFILKPKAVHAYLNVMDEVSMDQVERTLLLRKENGAEVKNYISDLYNWGLESIGVVTLDTRLGCLSPKPNEDGLKMIQLVVEIFHQIMSLELDYLQMWQYFKTPAWKRFAKNLDEFCKIVLEHTVLAIKRLETLPENHEASLLELLASTAKDPEHIAMLIIDLFMASIETFSVVNGTFHGDGFSITLWKSTGDDKHINLLRNDLGEITTNVVGMALYHLARHQNAQEKAYQEVKSVLQDKGMTPEALNNIRYLKACVKESMRLSPIIVTGRRTINEDVEIQGYHIPKGTSFLLNPYVTCRLEKYFPDSLAFHPERFLREQIIHDPFAFLPFGFGIRSCVGRRIAEQEIWILLMRLLERFRVECHQGEIEHISNFVNVPAKPLDFEFYER